MSASTTISSQSTTLTEHFKAYVSSSRIDTLKRVIDLVLAMITAQRATWGHSCPEPAHPKPGNSTWNAQFTTSTRPCVSSWRFCWSTFRQESVNELVLAATILHIRLPRQPGVV
ncbi:hypothetical protein [Deinococcus rubellus]|uniref:hypothetical protein n=1 Tax=Deinococcus rubellus TaxID=1889240 RepID=UPI0031EA578D